MTAGFRYESIRLDSDDRLSNQNFDTQFSDIKPKAGVLFDLADNHHMWFGYSEGFLAPDIDELFVSNRTTQANPGLEPEDATNYEVGFRGTLFEDRLAYETAFYYLNISQFIVSSENPDLNGPEFLLTNAGKVNLRGVETVIEYLPFDFLKLGITHTYARNQFIAFNNAGTDLSGDRLQRSPEHHVNARVGVLPLPGLEIEVEVDFYDGYETNDNNAIDPRGTFTRGERLNLRTTYQTGPFEVWLHALNITDTLEDRVGFSTRRNSRNIRTVDGFQIYGGVGITF